MTKVQKVYDAADGSATPGRVFTASIGLEMVPVAPGAARLDHLLLGMKGQIATTAIAIETFAATLSEYTLYVGGNTRIKMSMRQLIALMLAYYHDLPFLWENTDATGNNFIGGVKVPVYAPVEAGTPFTHSADWVTQTNQTAETLAIDAYYDTGAEGVLPIHAINVDHTTAAGAGVEQLDAGIPPVGKLRYLILEQVNELADGKIDISIQRAWIKSRTQGRVAHLNMLASHCKWMGRSVGVLDPMDDLLKDFNIIDLGPAGIDAKADELRLELDVQDVSDAVSITPVMELQ